MASLKYTVVILDNDEDDAVEEYFHKLATIFTNIVELPNHVPDTTPVTVFFDLKM